MAEKTARLMTSNFSIDIGGVDTVFTEDAIEDFLSAINGDRAVRQNLNHDPRFVPIGKIKKAWKSQEDGLTHLYATVDDTRIVRKSKYRGLKTNLLTVTYPDDNRPFVLETSNITGAMDVNIEPRNFPSFEEYEQFQSWVSQAEEGITAGPAFRFAEIPDPLIQFVVNHREAAVLIAFWLGEKAIQFMRQTADSTIKNLADKTGASLSDSIVKITERFCKQRLSTDSPDTVVVTLKTEPEINLITRSREVSGQMDLNANQMRRALEKYSEVIKDADSITFYRENKEQEWNFRYATTPDGKVITTKDTYRETANELERLRRIIPICVCMRNTITGETDHHETLAEFQPIGSDTGGSKYQFYFSHPPLFGQEGWEISNITLDPQGRLTNNEDRTDEEH